MQKGNVMQFLLLAYDYNDDNALVRRNDARSKHLENVKALKKQGRHLFGAAILDEDGKMVGSLMIVDYPSRSDLEFEWLKNEPYIINDVWEKVTIKPCLVPDFFLTSVNQDEFS